VASKLGLALLPAHAFALHPCAICVASYPRSTGFSVCFIRGRSILGREGPCSGSVSHSRRLHPHHHAPDDGHRLFRTWRAEGPGLVRRLRFFGNHGILHHANAHPRSPRFSCHLHGILRKFAADLWISHAQRRVRRRRQHARRRAHGAHACSAFYELGRQGCFPRKCVVAELRPA
jgi:hypothetical protein